MNSNNFQSYFDAEMRALAHLAHEHDNPEAVVENHHIDRLLEGVAYLTAQIRQRLDDDFPEIPAQLLNQHWPHMIHPYPAGVIMEFSSPSQLIIPKNTLIHSQPVGEEKTACKFSTVYDIEVNPVKLLKLSVTPSEIIFYFESKQPHLKINTLRLYLNTDFNTALEIYYAAGQAISHNLSSSQLWLDYFGFPEKFLFLELPIKNTDKYFEAKLIFKNKLHSNITDLNLKPEYFKLNCVPAINLYKIHSEPVIYKNSHWEYDVIPDKSHLSSILLHHIINITALDQGFKNNYNIDFQWEFLRSKLIIHNKTLRHNTVLSAEIMATNGNYPTQFLRENMINKPINLYAGITVKNITRPTQSLIPPMKKFYFWNLLNHLNLNLEKLELRSSLSLFNWTHKKSHKKQIDSILNAEIDYSQKIIKNSFNQLIKFKILLKEEGFRSMGEIYFFGSFLYEFLKKRARINYRVKLEIILAGTSKKLLWE